MQVLATDTDISLLVGKCRTERIFSVHPTRLVLRRHVLDTGLLLVAQVSKSDLQAGGSAKLLNTQSRLQVSLLRRHLCRTVTLELRLRTFKRRLQTTSFDITKLLAEVTFALKTCQKLATTAISALTRRAEVLNNLPLPRISHGFALLCVEHIANVRRHVLFGLRLIEAVRCRHLEALKVCLKLRLGSVHLVGLDALRNCIADVSEVTKSAYAKLPRAKTSLELRGVVAAAKLARVVILVKRAETCLIRQCRASAKLSRPLHSKDVLLNLFLCRGEVSDTVSFVRLVFPIRFRLCALHNIPEVRFCVVRQISLRYFLFLRLWR